MITMRARACTERLRDNSTIYDSMPFRGSISEPERELLELERGSEWQSRAPLILGGAERGEEKDGGASLKNEAEGERNALLQQGV